MKALFVLVLVIALAFVVDAVNPQLTHVSTVKVQNPPGRTVYKYKLESNDFDIHGFTIGVDNLSQCDTGVHPALLPTDQKWIWGTDQSNLIGYQWTHGQESGNTHYYYLSVAGGVGTGTVSFSLRGSLGYEVVSNLPGPDCGAPSDYPIFTNPPQAHLTVECNSSVADAQPGDAVKPGRCPGDETITRVTEKTDPTTSLTSHWIQTVHVQDTIAPWLDLPLTNPDPVECDATIPGFPDVSSYIRDNCEDDPVTLADGIEFCTETINGSTCPHNYFITRTWTLTDDCGNSACTTQTVTVQDTTAPVIIGVPGDSTLECTDDDQILADFLSLPTVTLSDNCCTEENALTRTDVQIDGCANTYTLERTWLAEDCCGNSNSTKQYLVIADTTAPDISFNPPTGDSRSIQCDDPPTWPTASATDICMDTDPVPTYSDHVTSGSCQNEWTIERAWTVTDDCGNTATHSKFLHFNDDNKPWFITLPEDTTVECGEVPDVPIITADDACGDASVTVSISEISGSCPNTYTILRTFTAEDACGNTNTTTQEITVIDTTPPLVDPESLQDHETVQCHADVTPKGLGDVSTKSRGLTPTAQSKACEETDTESFDEEFITPNTTCSNRYVLDRIWTFTDCSGNVATAHQTVTIHDDTAPILTGVPPDTTMECDLDRDWPTVTASDNCDAQVSVSKTEKVDSGSCAGELTVTRTWTAQDECGNSITDSQTITVHDTTPPTFPNPPSGGTRSCDNLPDRPTVSTSDNCGPVSLTDLDDEIISGICDNEYTLIMHWKATDDCGNAAYFNITWNIIDEDAPELQDVPSDTSEYCLDPSVPQQVCARDLCEGITLNFDEVKDPTNCEGRYTLNRTWTATDACGNTMTDYQTVNIYDDKAPVFDGTASDLTFECDNVNLPDAPTASDECSSFTIEPHHENNPGCGTTYIKHFRFRAVDACDNDAWYNYTVTVEDTTKPNLHGLPPAETTVECSNIPNPASVTATDNCGDPDLTMSPNIESGTCYGEKTITRTWTAEDDCSNTATFTQTINVVDTTPPTWSQTMPTDTTVDCTVPDVPASILASDNCGPAQVTFTQEDNYNCPNGGTVTRTWTAEDSCGNTITHTQVITVVDDEHPILIGVPGDTTMECDLTRDWPSVSGSDNCDEDVLVTRTEEIVTGDCPDAATVTRTWTAHDDCGNTWTQSQTITVEDSELPIWTSDPDGPITKQCTDDLTFNTPTASDNCDQSVSVDPHHYNITVTADGCFVEQKAWKGYDNCNNEIWMNWTLTVEDNVAPTLSFTPPLENITTTCTVPGAPTPSSSDNCDLSPDTSDMIATNTSYTCEYVFTTQRTWTVSDACGNSRDYVQTIELTPPDAPEFTGVPLDETVECARDGQGNYVEPNWPGVTAMDGCDVATDVSRTQTRAPGTCDDEYDLIRTWTTQDVCGTPMTASATTRIRDTTRPDIESPSDRHAPAGEECNPSAAPTLSGTDNCDQDVQVTVTTTEVSGDCPYNFTLQHSWTAMDNCGNTKTVHQLVYYKHETKPTLKRADGSSGLPVHETTAECDNIPDPETLIAEDSCGKTLEVSFTYSIVSGDCPGQYDIHREWSTEDDCGLVKTHTQVVKVSDTTPPSLDGVPSDTTVECGLVPDPADVCASDTCPGDFLRLNFTEEKITGDHCCNYTLVRTWTAIDACGIETPGVQTITVRDTIPPKLDGVPSDTSVKCDDVPPKESYTVGAFEAPVAEALCAQPTASTDECTLSSAPFAGFVWTQDGTPANFEVVATSVFVWQADGEAHVMVKVTNGTDQFWVNMTLRNGQSSGNAVKGLNQSCYPEKVDETTWEYYDQISGNVTHIGTNDMLHFFGGTAQYGAGASNLNKRRGLQVWANFDGTSDTGELALSLYSHSDQTPCLFEPLTGTLPNFTACEPIDVSVTEEEISGSCPHQYTLIRTWFATDLSGNWVEAKQTVHVSDNNKPALFGVPDDDAIECTDDVPTARVTASDNCATVSPEETITYTTTSCPHRYTIHRTWYVEDDCNNRNSATQDIEVDDTKDPAIFGVPETDVQNRECDNFSPYPTVTVSDECDDNPSLTNDTIVTSGSCTGEWSERRIWYAKDACDNPSEDEYTVYYIDTTAPTLHGVPNDVTYECTDSVPEPSVTWTDNCDVGGNVPYTSTTISLGCPNVRREVRTWTISDDCGNAMTDTQTITFEDTTNPTFNANTLPPAETTVQCDNVPDPAVVTATDNCGGDVVVTHTQTITGKDEGCMNEYNITRTYTGTDCSGNTVTFTALIKVIDDVPPTLGEVPADTLADCKDVPLPEMVCAFDNCPYVSVGMSETKDEDCPHRYNLTRTWTAEDACGNTDTDSQVVRVYDDDAPVWDENDLGDHTVECNETYDPTKPTATDHCDDNLAEASEHHDVESGSCPHEYFRHFRWRTVDACGNFDWLNITQHVQDTIWPHMEGVPEDTTIECSDTVPTAPQVTGHDNCASIDDPVPEETTESNGCAHNYTITRTWTVQDDCAHTVSESRTITVRDTTDPEFNSLPSDRSGECKPPTHLTLTATDNCDTQVDVDYTEAEVDGSRTCHFGYQLLRTWQASDECGNTKTVSATISVYDNTPPTLNGVPSDTTMECDLSRPWPQVTATDNCDYVEDIHVTIADEEDTVTDSECIDKKTITRTWTATDDCDNSNTLTQVIEVVDTTPPVFYDEEATEQSADCTNPPSWDLANPSKTAPPVSDNCDLDIQVTPNHEKISGTCTGQYDVHFHWTASDNCGNIDTSEITVHVTDTTAPHFKNPPADTSNDCTSIDQAWTVDYSDDCDLNPENSYTEDNQKVDGECENYDIIRTWKIWDDCGNMNTHTQTITVTDTTAPTFNEALPQDTTVECDDLPQPDVLTATDDCGSATVTRTTSRIDNDNDNCDDSYQLVHTWVATDLCGNKVTHTQTVTVQDTQRPEFSSLPAETTQECDSVTNADILTATDNCDDDTPVSFTQSMVSGNCADQYTLIRTWTVTDDCGNENTHTQLVTVVDTEAPVFVEELPQDTVHECTDPPTQATLTASDNCDTNVPVQPDDTISSGGCPANYTHVYTWTIEDDCSHKTTHTQYVVVQDTVPPEISTEHLCLAEKITTTEIVWHRYRNVSVPGNFFNASDDCSDIEIHITGCTSNQDTYWQQVADGDGFIPDCVYDPSSDSLKVALRVRDEDPVVDPIQFLGRIYTVTAYVEDECLHRTDIEKLIWLPYDQNSQKYVDGETNPVTGEVIREPADGGKWISSLGVDVFDVSEKCNFGQNVLCEDGCECEFNEQVCREHAPNEEWSITGGCTNCDVPTRTTTTFKYTLSVSSGAPRPARVLLGLDLTKSILVNTVPDGASLGAQPGTYINGLAWHDTSYAEYEFTLLGRHSSASGALAAQLSGTEEGLCQTVYLEGPTTRTFPVSYSVQAAGKVAITQVQLGNTGMTPIGVGGIIVEYDTGSQQYYSMTDENGLYSFYGTSSTGTVSLSYTDGFLKTKPAQFLMPSSFSASPSTDIDLVLYSDYRAVYDIVRYDVPATPVNEELSFHGDPRPEGFWQYHKTHYTGGAVLTLSTDQYDWAVADATPLSCGDLDSTSARARRLRTVALNHAARFGLYEPYRIVQEWYIKYIQEVECGNLTGSTADQTNADYFLTQLLENTF